MKIKILIDTEIDIVKNALAQPMILTVSGKPDLREMLRLRSYLKQAIDEYFDELENQPKASTLHP